MKMEGFKIGERVRLDQFDCIVTDLFKDSGKEYATVKPIGFDGFEREVEISRLDKASFQEETSEKLDVMCVPIEIELRVMAAMEDPLPNYEFVSVYRASEHPSDNYLFYVIGKKKNGTYASWIYNSSTGTFNMGHYDFVSYANCLKDVINNRINYL